MPKRTLRQARRTFEEITPGMNPADYQRLKAELDKASGAALAMATSYADRHVNDVLESRQEVLADLARLRDELTALAAEGEQGLLPSRDLSERLSKLHKELRAKERHAAEVDRVTTLVEAIENDPEDWADSMAERFPNMMMEFSF